MQKTRIMVALLFAAALLAGCSEKKIHKPQAFTDEVRLSYTPVKDQGRSSLCWAYAMLATIETEHIMRGDSVNLSAAYVARQFMAEQTDRCYLSRGTKAIRTRGMMPQLVRLIQTYGLMPYDSYNTDQNMNVAQRKLSNLAQNEAARGAGIADMRMKVKAMLDNTVNPLPKNVYMFSMEYTPVEFAHSVCMPDEYMAFTSFSHAPFGKKTVLAVPDNYDRYEFMNIPIEELMNMIERSVRSGHPVCWEGDTSETGFSFERGVADVREVERLCTQELRQKHFDTFRTTDDHCMAIIGIAHDRHGRKYFICKNSWGTKNPYGGLMYLSFDYVRLKTIAVMVNSIIF